MDKDIYCTFFFEECKTNRKRLFEEAIFHAKNGKVLYILREELNELPDLSQDLTSVNRHYMKMISFLYAKTLKSLIESISSLSEWQNVPSTIILDDLYDYCSKGDIQNACCLIAFLTDTARSCAFALKCTCRLYVCVSREVVGDEYCNTLIELYGSA